MYPSITLVREHSWVLALGNPICSVLAVNSSPGKRISVQNYLGQGSLRHFLVVN